MPEWAKLLVGAGGWAGFLASVTFNLLQHSRNKRLERIAREEREERTRKGYESEDERRRREEAPPEFYNVGGELLPLRISGNAQFGTSSVDCWGLVTVVNPTLVPMKIAPLRVTLNGDDWPVERFFFNERSSGQRSDRISLMGNTKGDYELHIVFPSMHNPIRRGYGGELWCTSSNSAKHFAIRIQIP